MLLAVVMVAAVPAVVVIVGGGGGGVGGNERKQPAATETPFAVAAHVRTLVAPLEIPPKWFIIVTIIVALQVMTKLLRLSSESLFRRRKVEHERRRHRDTPEFLSIFAGAFNKQRWYHCRWQWRYYRSLFTDVYFNLIYSYYKYNKEPPKIV